MRKLLFVTLLATTTALPAMALPFIDNDYAKALTRARAEHKPIFVEAWAPW